MLTAYAVARAGDWRLLVAAVGASAGAVLLAALIARVAALVPWAVALTGGEYATSLALAGGGIDPLAPLYAGALFLLAETAYWATERETVLAERTVTMRRLWMVLGTAGVAVLAAAMLLVEADVPLDGGIALEALGVAAAAATLAIVAWLARRHARS